MDFDELFGQNLLSDYPDVSMLGDEAASRLEAESHDIVGVYVLKDMDISDVMKQLKNAGYEETQGQSEYCIMRVDGDPLRITGSAYFR